MKTEEKPLPAWKRSILYRIAKFLFMGFVCLVTLIALIWAIENVRGSRAWARHTAELDALGEPWRLEDVVPPEVPDEQNFAMIPLFKDFFQTESNPVPGQENWTPTQKVLLSIYSSGPTPNPRPDNPGSGNWRKGEKINLSEFQQYYRYLAGVESMPVQGVKSSNGMDARMMERYGLKESQIQSMQSDGSETSENEVAMVELKPVENPEFPVPQAKGTPAEDVLYALTGYEENYKTITQALERPYARFPIRYEDGFHALLTHLSPLKACSQYFRIKSCAELQSGDLDQALMDFKLGIKLSESLSTEPLLISHLVRIAMIQILLQPVWEGWAGEVWEENQVRKLLAIFKDMNLFEEARHSLRGERAIATRSLNSFDELKAAYSDSSIGSIPFARIPQGWLEFNKVGYSSAIQVLIDGYAPKPGGWMDVAALKERITPLMHDLETTSMTPYNWAVKLLMPAIAPFSVKVAYNQATVDMTEVALACLGFKNQHGKWPERLEELVPDFFESMPLDPVNGKPFRYEVAGNGVTFQLYSLGWNLVDDGGEVVYKDKQGSDFDLEAGDWVWPWPVDES